VGGYVARACAYKYHRRVWENRNCCAYAIGASGIHRRSSSQQVAGRDYRKERRSCRLELPFSVSAVILTLGSDERHFELRAVYYRGPVPTRRDGRDASCKLVSMMKIGDLFFIVAQTEMNEC